MEQRMFEAETRMAKLEVKRISWTAVPGTRALQRVSRVALGLLLPLLLLAAWTLASSRGWVPPQILPPPGRVAATLIERLSSGELLANLWISLLRVFVGFAVGGVLGVVLGVAMGLSRTVEEYLYPSFKAVSQVPVLAFLLLGIGEPLKFAIIAQASVLPVALNVLTGIRNVPSAYVEVARAFEFSRRQLLRRVILPACVPALFVGLRSALTQAWLSLVTVELLASSEGLGFMIVWGRQLFQLDLVLCAIVMVGVVGLALDKGLELLEGRLLVWRPEASYGDKPAARSGGES
jgi:sulfonate transport system permease protein